MSAPNTSNVPNMLDPDKFIESANLQLSEYDMLMSMFPGKGELVIGDIIILKDFRSVADGQCSHIPTSRLDYSVNLKADKGDLRLNVTLPFYYPSVLPEVFVRSNTLSRSQQGTLNEELQSYLKSFDSGDLCIGSIITWLQENGTSYFNDVDLSLNNKPEPSKNMKFVRMWIYAHHIYSQTKRKNFITMATEFDLTGFCLPGKPGIVCIEGLQHNVNDWWHQVRTWNWQKIVCKTREEEDLGERKISELRRFPPFVELGSDNNIRVKSGGFHVDMGDVFRFLDEHQSGYMFEIYFGFAGKK